MATDESEERMARRRFQRYREAREPAVQAWRRSWGLLGYALGRTMEAWLGGSQQRAETVRALFQEALFNPDIARTLAMLRQPGATPAQIAPRLAIHALYLGARQAQQGEQAREGAGP